jgi:hypothetical protein
MTHPPLVSGAQIFTAANGTIQAILRPGAATYTIGLEPGESLTVMLKTQGHAVTLPSIRWVGGLPLVFRPNHYAVFTLWRVGSIVYGSVADDVE